MRTDDMRLVFAAIYTATDLAGLKRLRDTFERALDQGAGPFWRTQLAIVNATIAHRIYNEP